MASLSGVEAELNRLPGDIRQPLRNAFTETLKRLRFGRGSGQASENFAAGFLTGTTPSTPGDEFSLTHNFGVAPYLLIPVLPLDVVGSRLVPLTVSQAPDARRVYLTSTIAGAPITVYVEG